MTQLERYKERAYIRQTYGLFRVGATDDNPCDLFERIDFPVDEFFPPERCEFLDKGQDDPSVPCDDERDCDCDCDRDRNNNCDRDCRRK